MRFALLLLAALLLMLPVQAQPVLTEDAKLLRSGTSNFANPGWAIAAAEGFVVLGGRRDDSVYVFRETDGVWAEEAQLSASAPSFFTFGQAVGAWSNGREDLVIAGARGDSFRPETDAAYIFRRVDDTWVEEARLTNGSAVHEAFGNAVAIHGDYAVVGALGADDAGGTTGAAYVFRRTTDGAWVEDARLVASDLSMKAGFGRGVAIVVSSEGTPFALVGAPSDSNQQGAAYAFRRNSDGMWIEEVKLVEPDPEPDTGGLFGLSVAITETAEGDILALAGELGDQGSGIQSGAGYVFRREGSNDWVFEQKLTASDGQVGQRLGWSVALAAAPAVGGTVAVLGGDGAYNFAGTVRLFRRTTGETGPGWTEEAELWASDRRPGDTIGESVSASGRYAVAGAPNSNTGGPSGPGAGYVWDLRRAVPVEPAPTGRADRAELTAYPNPSSGGPVSLRMRLPRATHVRLDAYDALGRRVATLADRRMAAGESVLPLPADGWRVGPYFLRLRTETEVTTVPLTLLE